MAWKSALAATLLALTASGPAAAEDRVCGSRDPVDTIKELFAAIHACWQPPANSDGMSMTLTFSLRRDGSLIGKPRMAHAGFGADKDLNEAFAASVNGALDEALPVPFSASMGGATAGRILALRFTVGPGSATHSSQPGVR